MLSAAIVRGGGRWKRPLMTRLSGRRREDGRQQIRGRPDRPEPDQHGEQDGHRHDDVDGPERRERLHEVELAVTMGVLEEDAGGVVAGDAAPRMPRPRRARRSWRRRRRRRPGAARGGGSRRAALSARPAPAAPPERGAQQPSSQRASVCARAAGVRRLREGRRRQAGWRTAGTWSACAVHDHQQPAQMRSPRAAGSSSKWRTMRSAVERPRVAVVGADEVDGGHAGGLRAGDVGALHVADVRRLAGAHAELRRACA